MTDRLRAPLRLHIAPPETLLSLEVWGDRALVERRLGDPLPSVCRAVDLGARRMLWWEPDTWIARSTLEDRADLEQTLGDAAGDEGAVTDLSGGFTRIRVEGALWRELMMIGGVFDAEASTFGPGAMAGTVIHHMPVRLDVVSPQVVDAYTPPSYADDLLHHWTRSAARLGGL